MTDETPKKSLLNGNMLSLILKIMLGLVLFITVITNLMLVYIVFAPDELPKPFYLEYKMNQPSQTNSSSNNGHNTDDTGSSDTSHSAPVSPAPDTQHTTSYPQNSVILPGQGITVDTGTKIVNLAEPGGRKFIRTNVVLEFAPSDMAYYTMPAEEKTEFVTHFKDEINNRMPIINDTIITMLSMKDFESVYTSAGKDQLRAELQAALNVKLGGYHVISVYFTEFVMQ